MNYKLIFLLSVFLLSACQNPQGNNVKYNKNNIISFCETKGVKTPRLFFMLQMLYFSESKNLIFDRKKLVIFKGEKDNNPILEFLKYPKEAFVRKFGYEEAMVFYRENLNEMGMPYNAWILADVLDVVNERNKETLWQQFIFVMNNNDPAKEAKLFMVLWYAMVREAAKPLSDKQIKSKKWLEKMRRIALVNKLERKLDFMFEEMINDSRFYNKNRRGSHDII
ncbi:hypothetical protein [Providencia huaxiensis]|uniref:hypothetical protein n=1 Tax=Providencia huaxiensis TaxID=2027290 RepID=UPI001B358E55|nr:hypothetical protein [Providencia huaxiensis]MBQ0533170.1 hypothetical protein [Providencia huaxiensis]MBQ0588372.1 hypothetical protein [Providencia huaxiensis]MDI7238693.1 hypothetical protein [Providencia huaxiensis]